MSRPVSLLLAALVVVLAAAPAAGSTIDHVAGSRVLCSFRDPRILESSGLVDAGRLLFTTNDSGDGPYLYGVAKSTCRTVLTTTYSSHRPSDVEALAPGRNGSVWVGDIGDNTRRRSTIAVYHVPEAGRPRQVDAPQFTLRYPDGPHNAEALLVSPRDGRLYVVTKAVTGGTVYAAPAQLRRGRTNPLHAVAQVPGPVTDGAFLPDGSHVLLRTYGTATVFSFPGFRPLGTVRLPRQQQGEGLAVSPRGNLYLSSEGRYSPVLEVALPRTLARRAGAPGTATLGPAPTSADRAARPQPQQYGERIGWLFWSGLGVLALALLVWATVTFALPRSRRRR